MWIGCHMNRVQGGLALPITPILRSLRSAEGNHTHLNNPATPSSEHTRPNKAHQRSKTVCYFGVSQVARTAHLNPGSP